MVNRPRFPGPWSTERCLLAGLGAGRAQWILCIDGLARLSAGPRWLAGPGRLGVRACVRAHAARMAGMAGVRLLAVGDC